MVERFLSWRGEIQYGDDVLLGPLRALGNIDRLTLEVNSTGGNLFQARQIVFALKNLRANGTHITTIVERAHSGAAIVALAGDRRLISTGGTVMLHYASCNSCTPLRPCTSCADATDELIEFVTQRTGNSRNTVAGWFAAETYFSDDDCLRLGLVHAILPGRVLCPFDLRGRNRP